MSKKLVGAVVVVGVLGGIVALIWALSTNKIVIGYNKGYEPDQPIAFPHDIHAGKFQIDCKYCHAASEISKHATVPSVNVCMNCHSPGLVMLETPEIQKVREAFNSNKPVAWQKVHLLPDFVKFNHSAHIKAGKDCKECHGPVADMKKVYQHSSLSMGFCVNCHRKNNAPTSCGTCHY